MSAEAFAAAVAARVPTRSFRRWAWVHKWTSLICTVFLLMLCVTGLPLIFQEEIDDWLDPPPPYANLPADTPMASLDRMVAASEKKFPNDIVTSLFIDDDEPKVVVSMAPSWAATESDPDSEHWIKFDARTAQVLDEAKPRDQRRMTFMDFVFQLHRDLFLGLFGELFLGLMGLLFAIAIVSGVVLYGPFMKKLDFGVVRRDRSTRIQWLDLHNLLGIATLVWAFVVGATGVMNELSTPLFGLWQITDVAAMLAPYKDKPVPQRAELASAQAAFETAQKAVPGMRITSLVFPGAPFASPQHYLLWAKGDTALTSRLFNPILIDARSDELSAVVRMPVYLRALEVSRPLHFGDYGGLPLKILWAAFDLVAIVVLASGLYLWFARRRARAAS